ncbi:hypothetical protein ACSZMT_13830 [Aeromonas veronii]|uniref:hypothetical protein n=1 Tax=Aeromonas TaxID=642 RepID=UPI0013E0AA0B|nr:hypothetical protein [Aeromonas hydrophila]
MIAELLEKTPTSLEVLSNEHLQEQATKARFVALILHIHFLAQRSERPARSQPAVAAIKIGRNEPCPCGRGQEVQAVLFAAKIKIDRGSLTLYLFWIYLLCYEENRFFSYKTSHPSFNR